MELSNGTSISTFKWNFQMELPFLLSNGTFKWNSFSAKSLSHVKGESKNLLA
jgi:hypothetical protein